MSEHNESRRKFIKATVYTAPVILTLKAAPTFAKSGSIQPGHRHGHHQGRHGQSNGHRGGHQGQGRHHRR